MDKTVIRFPDGRQVSYDWLVEHEHAARMLLTRYKGVYPVCNCRSQHPLALYIAQKRRPYLARMPGTGPRHHPDCHFYEPPAQWTGRQAYRKGAIADTGQAMIRVRLVDGVGVISGKAAERIGFAVESAAREDTAGDGKRGRLALRGLLHLLLEEAGFTRWSPAMVGKRNYYSMEPSLWRVAQRIAIKNASLADYLYIPEPFQMARKQEIDERTQAHLNHLLLDEKGRRMRMLVVGEIKGIRRTEFGFSLMLAHGPREVKFWGDEAMLNALSRKVEAADLQQRIEQGPHLWCILQVERTDLGYLSIRKMAVQALDGNYLPVEEFNEARILDQLVKDGRRFLRPLAYDGTAEMALPVALLTDVGTDPFPLYVLGVNPTPRRDQALRAELQRQPDDDYWVWDVLCDPGDVPAFPQPAAMSTPIAPHDFLAER